MVQDRYGRDGAWNARRERSVLQTDLGRKATHLRIDFRLPQNKIL
jgi:hypothetical protein